MGIDSSFRAYLLTRCLAIPSMQTFRFLGHRLPEHPPGSLESDSLARADGHFALVAEEGPTQALYASHDGVTQVFYATAGGRFYWGTTVTEVAQKAGLPWRWNYEALGDFAVFGHLLGSSTLHSDVTRVGAGELVQWDGKSVKSSVIPRPVYDSIRHPADDAIDILVDSVRNQTNPDDVISISAGFDSRLILAAHLFLGLRPRLLVIGPSEATDVSISKAIAEKFELDIQQVELSGSTMLKERFDIARATSGTKTAENWHTYEYVAISGHKEGIWIGSNGEFARTFFVDRGIPFVAANALGQIGVNQFWKAKLSRTAIPDNMAPTLSAPFADSLVSMEPRLKRLHDLFPHRSLGLVNDSLYLERVRQFIANGLRLVSLNAVPKTPFLDARWIDAIRRCPRRQKLGNWWHRYAIGKLAPGLLDFPFDTTNIPMRTNPGMRYWCGRSSHSVNIPYFEYGLWFKQPAFIDALSQAMPHIDDLFKERPKLTNLSVRTEAFLAALAFFQQMAGEDPRFHEQRTGWQPSAL